MNATVLAGLLLLAPTQANGLQLNNVQDTHGIYGPARSVATLLPGEKLTITFDIAGLTVKDGKATYALGTEILSQGKLQYRQPAKDQEASLPLGGDTLQALAQFEIGLNTPPGEYEFKVTVTDSASKKTTSFNKTYTVLPRAFGIVRLTTTLDAAGEAHTTLLGAGQTLWISFSAVDFQRSPTTMQPNLTFELSVLDETGKPLGDKPLVGLVEKDVPAMIAALPGQFPLSLNRAGKFVVEVKATDNLSKKSAKLSFPITVQGRGN